MFLQRLLVVGTSNALSRCDFLEVGNLKVHQEYLSIRNYVPCLRWLTEIEI